MPTADLDGVSLFYTDEGGGEPVLLVHGWTCDSHDWQWQIPALLDAGYRVIAVDLRGHGRSTVPADGYTPRGFAADLSALLRRRDTGPVVAGGHSLGGAVVVALAVEHPELVRAIVPIDAAYGMSADDIGAFTEGLLPAIAGVGGHEAVTPLFDGFYTPASPAHLAAWHRRRMQGCPQHVLHDVLAGLVAVPEQFSIRPATDAYLARVHCPALVFRAGRQDPAAVANWERDCFPHTYSRAIAWEGTGHWLHQERPAEFNAIMLEWLGGLP